MKSESGFGLAMASPFHFGTESCYIFDFFLLAISLTIFFNMDDRQYLANVITTSWAGIVPNNMVMLPMDSSTFSASIILVEEFHLNGRYYSNQAPASLPLLLKLVSLLSFFVDIFWLFLDCLDYTIMDYSRLDSLIGQQVQLDYRNLY